MTEGRPKQQGFILLTALVFIIVLTVIVISTVNLSTSDEKIARNSRDKDLAFAAASAALRDAELYLSGSYMLPYDVSHKNPMSAYYSGGYKLISQLTTPPDQSDFFNTSDPNYQYTQPLGKVTNSPTINGGLSAQPRYLINLIYIGNTSPLCGGAGTVEYLFQITAQGVGRSPNTRVTLQEIYCNP
jgi:type IV pilus assembly protein PilX